MRVWITNVGRQTYAVINPIWMWLIQGYKPPDIIVLIYNENVKGVKNDAREKLKRLFNHYGLGIQIQAEETSENWDEYGRRFNEIIKKYSSLAEEIILDLTPGRKFMSVAASLVFYSLQKANVKVKLVYLHLLDQSYLQRSLSTIPFSIQRFIVRG